MTHSARTSLFIGITASVIFFSSCFYKHRLTDSDNLPPQTLISVSQISKEVNIKIEKQSKMKKPKNSVLDGRVICTGRHKTCVKFNFTQISETINQRQKGFNRSQFEIPGKVVKCRTKNDA